MHRIMTVLNRLLERVKVAWASLNDRLHPIRSKCLIERGPGYVAVEVECHVAPEGVGDGVCEDELASGGGGEGAVDDVAVFELTFAC